MGGTDGGMGGSTGGMPPAGDDSFTVTDAPTAAPTLGQEANDPADQNNNGNGGAMNLGGGRRLQEVDMSALNQPYCSMDMKSMPSMGEEKMCVELLEAMHDWLCTGMCSDACLNSDIMTSSANSDAAPNMGKLCKDGCFGTMAQKLQAVEKAERACAAKGEDQGSMSGNAEDQTESVEDMFNLGCTENTQGKNCMDAAMELGQDGQETVADTEEAMQAMICKDVASMGCCFGTMLAHAAWEEPEDGQQSQETDEIDFADFASMVSECPGGEAALVPCTAGSLKDITVIKSEVTLPIDFDALPKEEKKATKKAIAKGIATDLEVKPQQVIITKVTVTKTARRSLSSTTTDVDYQVTLNDDSATDASVKSKIESGSVSGSSIQAAAQQEGATSLSNADASQIQASQKAEEQTFEAEPPSASSGSSGMGAGALAGIVIGALVAVALIAAVAVVVTKRKPAALQNDGSTTTEVANPVDTEGASSTL
jgi:hypothetical protein